MIDLARRIVVAAPPVGEAFWSGLGPVGLVRYRDAGSPRIAIVARVVSPFPAAGEPFLPGEPIPVPGPPPLPSARPPIRGRELVPYKHACDVGFIGTLVAASAYEAARSDKGSSLTMDVRVDEVRRVVTIPVSGPRVDIGAHLGPRAIEPIAEYAQVDLEEGTEEFRSVGAEQRFPFPEAGARFVIASSFFSLDAVLGFEVFLRVDYLDGSVSLPIARCDAVTFDLDRREVEWVFRGLVSDPSEGREIERVVVAAFAPGKDEERARVDAWLPHAAFDVAAGPEHARAGVHPPPLDEEELSMARYSTWDLGPFASTLPLEEVARIQVALTRKKDRAAVLEAHGLSAYAWSVEERAAMERLADASAAAIEDEEPDEGRPALADEVARYEEAHARAMAEIPFEGRAWSAREYAELRAAMEARNPVRVLQEAGLGPAELIGLDSTMEARFEANEEERREFDERFAEALARFEAEGDGAEDFEPPEDEDEDGEDER
jgi:hypothetical protein